MANNITADVSLNIRELMQEKGIKKEIDFANELGISKQLLSKWKSRNTYDVDKIVDKFPEVSKVWLLTGEGEMLKSESAASRVESAVPMTEGKMVADDEESYQEALRKYGDSLVPEYDIEFRGGPQGLIKESGNQRLRLLFEKLIDNKIIHSQAHFGQVTGLDKGNLSRYLNDKKEIGEETLVRVVSSIQRIQPSLNRDWLVYGEGSMLKSESAAHRVENNVRPILVGEKEWADVPLVPFSARAGALCGFGDPQWLEDKQTMQVLVDSRLKGDYVLFEVEGDSMDDGSRDSFLDGDVLLCRIVPQSDWQYSIKRRRATFCVLATKLDGIALKQITKHDRVKQVITCHSLNPAYDDYELALSDVQAIFYVEELNKRVY